MGKTFREFLAKGGGVETHEKRHSNVQVHKKRTDWASGGEGEKISDNTHRGSTNFGALYSAAELIYDVW